MTSRPSWLLCVLLASAGCSQERSAPRDAAAEDAPEVISVWTLDGEVEAPAEGLLDDRDWTITRFGFERAARFDFDRDGQADNLTGSLLYSPFVVQELGGLSEMIQSAIDDGSWFVLLDSVGFDSHLEDPQVGVRFVSAQPSVQDFANTMNAGFVDAGTLQTAGSSLVFDLPLQTTPVRFQLRHPRLRAELISDGRRIIRGVIGGAIPTSELRATLLSLSSSELLQIIVDHVLGNAPDVDLDGDGVAEAASISFFFEAEATLPEDAPAR